MAQQPEQQQGGDHQRAHAQREHLLAPVRGRGLQRRDLLLGFEQGDLLFLQPGVELHLQVRQPTLARDLLGLLRGRRGVLEVHHRTGQVPTALGQARQQLLGLGDGEVRILGKVVLECASQQRLGFAEVAVQGDQAFGDHQARAPCAGREAGGLEIGQCLAAPVQRLEMATLRGQHLADAVLAVGDEDRIASLFAGGDLATAPGLGFAEVARMVLGERDVGQRQAERTRVSAVPGLDVAQRAQREVARLAGLADDRVQVAGGTQQPGRFPGGLREEGQALAEPGEGVRPVLDVGGDVDGRGVHAHAQRCGQLLPQQLREPLQRLGLLAGDAEIAQAHVLDAVALEWRELVEPRCQGLDAGIRFAPGRGDRQALDLDDPGLQGVLRERRQAGEGQPQQRGGEQPGHVHARWRRRTNAIRRRRGSRGWWRTARRRGR